MPLHGKVVVIKRSGGDGTEFPLTTTCLFGRKADCDIRIQLPHVSKEHCRIDLNENKEVILTNLSSSNPTRVNGKTLQQSERLKHGDLITIIDRSFRFEYPPPATPKKRASSSGKNETFKVLQDQQAVDGAERTSEVSKGPHLKDGASHDNIQRSLEKTLELESTGDNSQRQSKSNSPFSDLYEMIKQSLDVKTPCKSSASQIQTPSSKFCTPRPAFTPKRDEAKVVADPAEKACGTLESAKKQVGQCQIHSAGGEDKSEATTPLKRSTAASQKVNDAEDVEPISPRSPARKRKSLGATPARAPATEEQVQTGTSPNTTTPQRQSPRNIENVKKRCSAEIKKHLQTQSLMRKRVSFGGQLSPELFDKRLPPDSPLRKGAAPRRSYSVFKPKQSLLRRASVIGFLKENSPEKTQTPSPKRSLSPKNASGKTPTKSTSPSIKPASPSGPSSPKNESPRQRSPKAVSPAESPTSPMKKSPKTATPGKKSPKSKSPSPATGRTPETQKSRTTTPDLKGFKETPLNRRRSSLGKPDSSGGKKAPSVIATPTETSLNLEVQTPTVKGRFSVSRISTPSPSTDTGTDTVQEPQLTVTPKIGVKRKSMKSATRKTPTISRAAVKVMLRRSGFSRMSMKCAWADIVKFGKVKPQVVAPPKKKTTTKKTKQPVLKTQTPARKVVSHVSTGHANSPVTIIVGKAHKLTTVPSTGAAPKFVTNTAVHKKNLKMDEDLTGISEMFKTPAPERKRKSFITESSVTRTPAGSLGMTMVDQSVLHTPEELGEMIVSPLNVASTVKSQSYNSEAVQRLLHGEEEASFVYETSTLETRSGSTEEPCSDLKTQTVATPKQKSECLTGVKRLMVTPKQKPENPECLTGVKRIMKTPRQKAEPLEDLRGKILKTPKQKREAQECLTGVKRLMKTPRQKAEPLEDLRGKILKTPKQKKEAQECLTGVKRIMKTPRQKAEPVEDLRGKILKTPKQKREAQECLTGVKRIMKTPRQKAEPVEDIRGKLLVTPKQKLEQQECFSGVRQIFKILKQKSKPLEDLRGKLLETPKSKEVCNMDLEGVKELLQTPKHDNQSELTDKETISVSTETIEAPQDQNTKNVKEIVTIPKQKAQPVEENFGLKRLMKSPRQKSKPIGDFEGLKEMMEEPSVCREAGRDDRIEEPRKNLENITPELQMLNEISSEMKSVAEVKVTDEEKSSGREDAKPIEAEEPCEDAVVSTPVRGIRQKKQHDAPHADTAEAHPDEPEVLAPVRGRKENKMEATVPLSGKKPTRGRRAKSPECPSDQPLVEKEDQTETPSDLLLENTESDPPADKVPSKPLRGRKTKPTPVELERTEESLVDKKPKRGRKTNVNDAKQDAETTVETKQEPQPLVRGKRGRNARKVPDEAESATEVLSGMEISPETESEQTSSAAVQNEAKESPELPENVVVEPEKSSLEQHDAPDADTAEEAHAEEPEVLAPVRGRKGKKVEATAPAGKKSTRGRRAKSPEAASDQPVVEREDQAVTPSDLLIENTESGPSADKVPTKALRGRKTKPAPVEPERTEESLVDKKPKRGRKINVDAEEAVSTVESTQEPQPSVRGKRGRNARKVPDEAESIVEVLSEMEISPETESEKISSALVQNEANVSAELPENVVVKPETSRPEQHDASDADTAGEAHPEEPEVLVPVRGRKAKKIEATVPSAGKKPTRGRRAKSPEGTSDLPVVEKEDQTVTPSDLLIENTESGPSADKVASKPLRGRKTKPTPVEPERTEESLMDKKPKRGRKTIVNDAETTVSTVETKQEPQPPVRGKRGRTARKVPDEVESVQEVPLEIEMNSEQTPAAVVENEAKESAELPENILVEPKKSSPEKHDAPDADTAAQETHPKEPEVLAPVRGRKGKKMEATASNTGKKSTRGRRAKSPEATSDQPVVEREDQTETPSDPLTENTESGPSADKVPSKPLRGRKSKSALVKLERIEEILVDKKPKRGRKTTMDVAEQDRDTEDTVETKQEPQPPVRGKRGRNAKREVEENTIEFQEPVQKSRKTRKPEVEEAQTVQMVAPEKLEVTAAESDVHVEAAKPRRGGRKAKSDTESMKPAESTHLKDLTTSIVKPKLGRRGKPAAEEAEQELEVEKEPEQIPKTSMAKKSQAKRTRQDAALPPEGNHEDCTVPPSAKRSRRPAAKPTADEALAISDLRKSEDLNDDSVQVENKSSKCVRWNSDVQVFDIPKATPVKSARGRKAKIPNQHDAESKTPAKEAGKAEEEDLSETVVKPQLAKRGRCGAKVARETSSEQGLGEAETKRRRGRPAKK